MHIPTPSFLHEILPSAARQNLYIGYGVLGAGLGSVLVAYAALDQSIPKWAIAALAVYGYLGGVFGLTAAANPAGDYAAFAELLQSLDGNDPIMNPDDGIYGADQQVFDFEAVSEIEEYEGRRRNDR